MSSIEVVILLWGRIFSGQADDSYYNTSVKAQVQFQLKSATLTKGCEGRFEILTSWLILLNHLGATTDNNCFKLTAV